MHRSAKKDMSDKRSKLRSVWGVRLRELRDAQQKNQAGVAEAVGHAGNWLSLVEKGQLDPALSDAVLLVRELGGNLDIQAPGAPGFSVLDALRSDPDLSDEDRDRLREMYVSWRRRRQRPEAAASGS